MFTENMPHNPSRRTTRVYLLRVWFGERTEEHRLRLEDFHSGQSILLYDLQELAAYLAQVAEEEISHPHIFYPTSKFV